MVDGWLGYTASWYGVICTVKYFGSFYWKDFQGDCSLYCRMYFNHFTFDCIYLSYGEQSSTSSAVLRVYCKKAIKRAVFNECTALFYLTIVQTGFIKNEFFRKEILHTVKKV